MVLFCIEVINMSILDKFQLLIILLSSILLYMFRSHLLGFLGSGGFCFVLVASKLITLADSLYLNAKFIYAIGSMLGFEYLSIYLQFFI